MVRFKKGLVLNFRNNGKFSKLITHGLAHYYSHTAIIVDDTNPDTVKLMHADGGKSKGVVEWDCDRGYLRDKFLKNELAVYDFKLPTHSQEFWSNLKEHVGKRYDYFTWLDIFLIKVFKKRITNLTTKDFVDCSELIARIIDKYKCTEEGAGVLQYLGKSRFEEILPQDIDTLFNKWKVYNKI